MANSNQFRGIAFPFSKSAAALPAPAFDDDLIKQSLFQIIMTAKGERAMRPEFGSNATSFIFENNDLVLQETIRAETMSAISKFEGRVIVRSVDVLQEDSFVTITILYVVKSTRQEQTLEISVPRPE